MADSVIPAFLDTTEPAVREASPRAGMTLHVSRSGGRGCCGQAVRSCSWC